MENTAPPDDEVIFITVNDGFWVANGVKHLDAILMGGAPYPTPIRCIAFRDMRHLTSYIEAGTEGLWAVHPKIVERLRAGGEIADETAP
jgi:hypothetical protein